jgi:hypothetical protein
MAMLCADDWLEGEPLPVEHEANKSSDDTEVTKTKMRQH